MPLQLDKNNQYLGFTLARAGRERRQNQLDTIRAQPNIITSLNDHSYEDEDSPRATSELVARNWLLRTLTGADNFIAVSDIANIAVSARDLDVVIEAMMERGFGVIDLSTGSEYIYCTVNNAIVGDIEKDFHDSVSDQTKTGRMPFIPKRHDHPSVKKRERMLTDWRDPELTNDEIEKRHKIGQEALRRDFGSRFPFGLTKPRTLSTTRAANDLGSLLY